MAPVLDALLDRLVVRATPGDDVNHVLHSGLHEVAVARGECSCLLVLARV